MSFSAIREIVQVMPRTEIGKGEIAVERIFTECVVLSRQRAAVVDITVNGIGMHIYSSPLNWVEDPRREAARWREEYIAKLVREMDKRLPPTPTPSVIYITAPLPEGPCQA
jgi:hypothetical protein